MRFVKSLILVLILAAAALQGQSSAVLGVDLPDAEIPATVRFEVQINTDPVFSVPTPAPQTLPDTLAGHKTFAIGLPVLNRGDVTIVVRTCTLIGCSNDSSPLTFKMIGPPTNLRIIKGGS